MTRAKPPAPPPYHHGDLRRALLEAAERILVRDGIECLTLRATAREAGVSHAAPKNHFGDLRGLLSDLAAVGFTRLGTAIEAEIETRRGVMPPLDAAGLAYVRFARDNVGLFTLMFRGERLDYERQSLDVASKATFARFVGSMSPVGGQSSAAAGGAVLAARSAAAWSLVHGFACLMLDHRLDPLLRQAGGVDAFDLLAMILRRGPAG